MDGVSTAISLFSSGYTAFKKIRDVRQAIKDAPDQLASLEHSCALIEKLLESLKTTCLQLPSNLDLHHLKHLSDQAQRHLDEVEKIAEKVTKECADEVDHENSRKIRRVKWMLQKENIERIEMELKELQSTLGVLHSLVQSCVYITFCRHSYCIINTIAGIIPSCYSQRWTTLRQCSSRHRNLHRREYHSFPRQVERC